MFKKCIAVSSSILSLSFLAVSPSFASLDSYFSQCAAAALEKKSVKAAKISVDLPTSSYKSMDHTSSTKFRDLKMELADAQSGELLGNVSCRIDSKGAIESVSYLSQLD